MFDTSGNKHKVTECFDELGEVVECVENYEAGEDLFAAAFYLTLVLGLLLVMSQTADLLYIVVPKKWLQVSRFIGPLVTPAAMKQERNLKKAAAFKVSKMLESALEVGGHVDNSLKKSTSVLSDPNTKLTTMERYLLVPEQTETVGGFFWAWKRICSGEIFVEEGIR